MAKQSGKYSLLLVAFLIIALLFVRFFKSCNNSNTPLTKKERNQIEFTKDTTDSRTQWRYRTLVYTKHAKCRMNCRDISESEVIEIQHNGKINYRKSNLHDNPCASYAVEGITNDKQELRIVFGACEKITTVITCIDLEVEHICDCK